MQPLAFDDADLADWYAAYRLLGAAIADTANHVSFRLDAGDTLFVNGYRVLHARTAYQTRRPPTPARRLLRDGRCLRPPGPDERRGQERDGRLLTLCGVFRGPQWARNTPHARVRPHRAGVECLGAPSGRERSAPLVWSVWRTPRWGETLHGRAEGEATREGV